MAKVTIALEGSGGLLERKDVEYREGDDPDEALNLAMHEAIEDWVLSVGDTIKIRETGWRKGGE